MLFRRTANGSTGGIFFRPNYDPSSRHIIGCGYQLAGPLAFLPPSSSSAAAWLWQYGRSRPWLQPGRPAAISTTARTKPMSEILTPNSAVRIHGRFLHWAIRSCCSLRTHSAGRMYANGAAFITPCIHVIYTSKLSPVRLWQLSSSSS